MVKAFNEILRPRKSFPPMPGVICRQMVRCGKPNCKCARGEKHEAYYRFWRDGEGRQHKEYIRRANLAAARQACEVYKENNAAFYATLTGPDARRVKREIRAMLRQAGAPVRIVRRYE